MRKENILIVDDSLEMLEVLRRQLKSLNFYVFQASNVNDAIEILKATSIDLLITDLQMPGIDGMQLVKYASEHFPNIPTLVITGFPSVSGAIEAVKSGVFEYLVKPFTQLELKNALEESLLKFKAKHPEFAEKKSAEKPIVQPIPGIVGNSEKIQEVAEIIRRISGNKATVLIQGESGTGKELIARAIHYTGNAAKGPFITVNCGAIPENLLESELFGFVKGSFTGANETRAGFFQAADGGTIFLDEIGNASLTVQNRLLRVIQEKEVTMIGSNKTQGIDVRIIAATNSDLFAMSKSGTFREDLYYRLNVINIISPNLRDRKEDIPLLVRYFIHKFSNEFAKSKITITDLAMEVLQRNTWPGNIRELENVIQRAVILCQDQIDVQDLPDYLKMENPEMKMNSFDFKSLKEMEKEYVQKVLEHVQGNKTKAAEILGIDRKTLRQKLN